MRKPGKSKLGRASFGWQIQTLARITHDTMKDRLRPLGLKIGEFSFLMSLLDGDGSTQTELGRITGFPEYAVSRVVDRLVDRKLVERRPHPTSRRAFLIFLTDQGKELTSQLPPLIEANNSQILSGLDASQRQSLGKMLGTVIACLDQDQQ